MITDLKRTLRELRFNRLTNYSETSYQKVNNDWNFEHVSEELRARWYSQDILSFNTLSIHHNSDIEFMSENELIQRIENERFLITSLEDIFLNLKNK